MFNFILSIFCIVLVFTVEVIIEKIFKKEGLFAWMIFATITANIIVCKNIEIAGISFTLANILFASNFLATDILTEKYTFKESKKAVYLSLVFALIFMVGMQIAMKFIPSETDIAQPFMEGLFTLNLRTTLSSVLMFFLSNLADVYLFKFIKDKVPNKLWLRNNVATITTNCLENFLFVLFAFIGIYDISLIIEIALTTCLAEVIIGICDTPFIYLAKSKWLEFKNKKVEV